MKKEILDAQAKEKLFGWSQCPNLSGTIDTRSIDFGKASYVKN
jgi:hypothetical protein